MKCPTCNESMQRRMGKFGEFYYCPNQYTGCTQPTISNSTSFKVSPVAPKSVRRTKAPHSTNSEWNERSYGTEYQGRSCACGKNIFMIGGGGYCESCGHPAT